VSASPADPVLDAPTDEAYVAAIAPLFEGAPRFLARVAEARPFETREAFFAQARAIAHDLPESEQIELLDAHPRLGAPPGEVSALSYVEQGYDDDDADEVADPIEIATALERLNADYEARFGFRYCVFVAGRSREVLLPDMAAALGEERDAELHRGLDAVIDIAVDRSATLLVKNVEAT
jgi:2-oxo-4-hydroxy-4-carboxy--5-ureidoimidazoline (OHCU) decarboxylase